MADFVFNISKGRLAQYADLSAANDALILMLIESSGVESDAVLKDKDDFSALVSGATNEQTTMGRKTINSSVTVTVDDTNDRTDIDIPDQVYTGSAGNPVSDSVIGYDSDTTSGTDSGIVPMTQHDTPFTPDGTDVTLVVATAGFARAS